MVLRDQLTCPYKDEVSAMLSGYRCQLWASQVSVAMETRWPSVWETRVKCKSLNWCSSGPGGATTGKLFHSFVLAAVLDCLLPKVHLRSLDDCCAKKL